MSKPWHLYFLVTFIIMGCTPSSKKVEPANSPAPFEEAPILINQVKPEYPANAIDLMVTGTIWVKALVDSLGDVTEVVVIRDVGENITFFRQSAIDAAMKTKWKPARSNGKPIAVWVTFKVDFDLK